MCSLPLRLTGPVTGKMKLILFLFLTLTALGLFEMGRHWYMRRRVPIRIHVNGSRGKSSVARLIAAGLQAGGVATLAKTTGSAARIIFPDGREMPVRRRGAPNIREQLRVFRRAARVKAEAIVLECMAVRPDLQWICEHRIVHATIGVITNVRPDHLEAMGPRIEDVAESLSGTVPRRGLLLTAERPHANILRRKAESLGCEFRITDPSGVTKEELSRFSYLEFADNLSLALDACEAVGVPREKALEGMWEVKPDLGALLPCRINDGGKEIDFLNLFAANDPESTAFVWEHLGLDSKEDETLALINIRADRMRRSKDLAPLFEKRLRAHRYVLIGEMTAIFSDILVRGGVPREKIVDLGDHSAEAVWDRLLALTDQRSSVVGVGNIGGVGVALLDLIEGKERAS